MRIIHRCYLRILWNSSILLISPVKIIRGRLRDWFCLLLSCLFVDFRSRIRKLARFWRNWSKLAPRKDALSVVRDSSDCLLITTTVISMLFFWSTLAPSSLQPHLDGCQPQFKREARSLNTTLWFLWKQETILQTFYSLIT